MHQLPKYPKDHQVGVEVPPGGSNCAKCKYVSSDMKRCSEKHFVAWNGGDELPFPAARFCCDFWTAKPKTKMSSASELRVKK